MRAVNLYIKYGKRATVTVRELGYPGRRTLHQWYCEYLEAGGLHKQYLKKPKYSQSQKEAAVNYYLEHGRNITQTAKVLGYPARAVLRGWIRELAPEAQNPRNKSGSVVQLTPEQKKDAVIDLCTRQGPASVIAAKHGVSRYSLYKWRKSLLKTKGVGRISKRQEPPLPDDRDLLLAELESLKQQVYRQQMELDILRMASELLKKDQGTDYQELTNREKAILIGALRNEYSLRELLKTLSIPKSSYYYQFAALKRSDKHATLREEVKQIFLNNKKRYGYRRIHAVIRSGGLVVSEKVIRRLMREEQLVVPFKRRRSYSSYMGEISPAVENLIDRDFHANAPNQKWVTDLTEFGLPSGKVFLSPIIDCYDGMVVSWTIGTSPNADLVNEMLDVAISSLTDGEHPILHSDRGAHYRWPGWIERMQSAGLTRSMSKKGCTPDNAACEGFFGRVKNEMFYFESWQDVSLGEFIDELDAYVKWYNRERIKVSLGGMSPLNYRQSIGLSSTYKANSGIAYTG